MLKRRPTLNDLFREFDSVFNQFDSIFESPIKNLNEKTEEGTDENGRWLKQTFSSDDGTVYITNFYRTSLPKGKSEPKELDEISKLRAELQKSTEVEDYEKAIELRDKIKVLESNKEKLDSLKSELNTAVKNEDFEKAIELRNRIKNMIETPLEPQKRKK